MKQKFAIISLYLMIMLLVFGVATAEDVHHTVIFHSGDLGIFTNDETTNVVEYGNTVEQKLITKYSHTFNVDDDGTEHSYGSSTYHRDINGSLALSVSPSIYYDLYTLDSFVCATETDSVFTLSEDKTLIDGQLTDVPLTFELRYKRTN